MGSERSPERLEVALSEHPEGVVLPVRAQPGARKAGVQGVQAGALKVAVTAPPEDGKANKALVRLLRELLGLKRSQLELISGQTSRDKRFLIRGLTLADVRERLEKGCLGHLPM
jgi:uncharacterized protein